MQWIIFHLNYLPISASISESVSIWLLAWTINFSEKIVANVAPTPFIPTVSLAVSSKLEPERKWANMTCGIGTLASSCLSIGIPRPLSETVINPVSLSY